MFPGNYLLREISYLDQMGEGATAQTWQAQKLSEGVLGKLGGGTCQAGLNSHL